MKVDITLALLFMIAIWLLFFRKTEKYCGGCGGLVA